MRYECRLVMAWFPDQQLRQVQRVHVGPLFEVLRARLGGRDVAIKRYGATPQWDAALVSVWQHDDPTNVFYHRHLGWTNQELPPGPSHFEALLRAEHAVIERVTEHWNHPGAQLARWRGDAVIALAQDGETSESGTAAGVADDQEGHPYRTSTSPSGALCLVMPWCNGDSFAILPNAEQRRWFPAMLPALWKALTVCPHGDLSPANLMLEREQGFFRILDPGVRITGPSREAQQGSFAFGGIGSFAFSSDLLTTNVAHYPLVMPEHGPAKPRLCPPAGGLAHIVVADHESFSSVARYNAFAPPAVRAHAPAAADVVACGAIYFSVLAGEPLASLLGIRAPLWAGSWSDRGHCPASPQPFLDRLADGAIARALRPTGAASAEIALCERLVMLDLDGDALSNYVADVLRALG